MTLVYNSKRPAETAQTHVLAIGVGRYPHLIGGSGKLISDPLPLGQLDSPPVSARSFAGWFLGQAPEPYMPPAGSQLAQPLGTVELLVSDPDDRPFDAGDGAPVTVAPANFQNIQDAFNDWEARCAANPENIAIFYFCGHGLQKDSIILLPEDFGSNSQVPWTTAVDFDRTFRGMAGCSAKTQCFIVDACRQWTDDMLLDLDVTGQTLKRAKAGQQMQRTAQRLFASASTLPAFGDDSGISRLTQALLTALNGGGADRHNGRWRVDTDRLGLAVQRLVELQNKQFPPDQRQIVDPAGGEGSAGTRVLHLLQHPPEVLVSLCCRPDAATVKGQFYYVRNGNRTPAPAPGAWSARLEAGVYDFGVSFEDGSYRGPVLSDEFIRPPVWPLSLEVE